MARDPALGANEKVGMPDALRAPFDDAILADVMGKIPALARRDSTVVDIGCGCGSFTARLVASCRERGVRLVLVDSAEMLDTLGDTPGAVRIPGRFPDNAAAVAAAAPGGADGVLAYGVLSIVFADANPFAFVDGAANLLAPGGHLLIGDIPNASKLRRFLASDAGARFHRAYMRSEHGPEVAAFDDARGRLDDGAVFGIAHRMRAAGYDAYIVPQAAALPMANRREDVLVVRP